MVSCLLEFNTVSTLISHRVVSPYYLIDMVTKDSPDLTK